MLCRDRRLYKSGQPAQTSVGGLPSVGACTPPRAAGLVGPRSRTPSAPDPYLCTEARYEKREKYVKRAKLMPDWDAITGLASRVLFSKPTKTGDRRRMQVNRPAAIADRRARAKAGDQSVADMQAAARCLRLRQGLLLIRRQW
jgi:hypothetical protein